MLRHIRYYGYYITPSGQDKFKNFSNVGTAKKYLDKVAYRKGYKVLSLTKESFDTNKNRYIHKPVKFWC